jgi:undecaprenyl-diphosphatase
MNHGEKRNAAKVGLWISLVLVLSSFVFYYFIPSLDHDLSSFFTYSQNLNGIIFMEGISNIVSPVIIVLVSLLILGWFIFKEEHEDLYLYLSCITIGPLLAPIIKQIFQRIRPSNIFAEGFSFTSGHTVTAMAFFGSMALILWPKYKKLSLVLLIFPILIGISRMYLNAHWMSDVLGGIGFGMALVCGLSLIFYQKKKEEAIISIK